ncbi:MAG: hypothetical protein JWN80_2120 [Microbacteriaceae bacterium]|nr:hypothetical protein [Microbacteriaceae bacterium]
MDATLAASGTLLHTQARRLEVLAARLAEAQRRLPARFDLVWRGSASIVYWVALDRLISEFATAHQLLDTAASTSRRAAATVTAAANG